ncbi:beta-D-glucosyl crocetin beta-1,6-glucosyltransferase-like [Olea europaea subsp. europaea]|uniref:Beta-D-glucosyl crocetin beta-1,6-glucosyltransferase-like n=1 Tax=Olea europaea subsp. europaea TaxID=158383 RepID=A0A8S0SEL1_OLEEU|nr:beta-D-glucosyl crocetin beta-1,6-glucosyltransferase-like [Olea europaea subsp. europaea]
MFYRDYEIVHRERLQETAANEQVKKCAFQGIDRSSRIVLVKGFREIEGEYGDYLSSLLGKKVVPVGPLVQDPTHDVYDSSDIMEWLDKKDKNSIVFVSFGTEYFLTKQDMLELAYGHCGCSSVMESMKFGIPIIAMPMHLDQPLNARLVEDIGIRVEAREMSEKIKNKGDEEIDEVVQEFVLLCDNKKRNGFC